jgi:hypothetical protein
VHYHYEKITKQIPQYKFIIIGKNTSMHIYVLFMS